jgi:hypothetical protein
MAAANADASSNSGSASESRMEYLRSVARRDGSSGGMGAAGIGFDEDSALNIHKVPRIVQRGLGLRVQARILMA